eukprot:gnl/TRDRNA2_/TRDRNA2_126911_c0_seq1.p1 gnl/TRDRNA2_/TRDRNA2_126911_c0~~gnl/TRDRNA2_/TRDRNA2_126911_c0_seq1.p1  ORF type:complete len:144 (+),score=15.32 gnl/TRDRNA2_/TRDRNA2_126911_c0_seq1:71-502(+)
MSLNSVVLVPTNGGPPSVKGASVARKAVWVVHENKDLLVRRTKELSSPVVLTEYGHQDRLARGSLVEELHYFDDVGKKGDSVTRVKYRLLSGYGPKEGWVSLSYKGQPLLTERGHKMDCLFGDGYGSAAARLSYTRQDGSSGK